MWLVAAYVYGAILLLSLCPQVSKKSAVEGMQRRGLAEGVEEDYDDLSLPSTPELADFCSELEARMAHSSTEMPRASPLLVQAFFDELEGGQGSVHEIGQPDLHYSLLEEGQTASPAGFSMKRAASEGSVDEDEVALPSRKVHRKDDTPSATVFGAFFGDKEVAAVSGAYISNASDPQSSKASSSTGFPNVLGSRDDFAAKLELRDLSSFLPSDREEALPSSAALIRGSSSAFSGEEGSVHPWVRIPPLEAGVTPRPFRESVIPSGLFEYYHAPTLLKMREVLSKPVLSQDDADCLVVSAELLANHVYHKMAVPVSSRRPASAVEGLGRRFMAFYMLHLASKAVRQQWQQAAWWRELANAVPTNCPYSPEHQRAARRNLPSITLAMELSAALELYKSGSSPPEHEVIRLMRQLLCSQATPFPLADDLWDAWRQDDYT
ncbi:hypothetical protein Emag_001914 [Eimeria magna]